MKNTKPKYNLPPGFTLWQSALKSKEYLKDPILFTCKYADKYAGSYSSAISTNGKLITTQNPGFINHILRDNHKNYQKSPFALQAAKFFGNGLLYSNGDSWLRQRRLIQPGFHKEKIHGLYDIIVKVIRDFTSKFPVGQSVDVYPLCHQLSFNILIRSLFDINLDPKTMEELKQILGELQGVLLQEIVQPWQKLIHRINGKQNSNRKKAQRLREIVKDIIQQRKASGRTYNDLLDMLLNSKYEDTGETMGDEQIIDEVLILILAGHESTANSISWLLYLIASNSGPMQKLIASFKGSTIDSSLDNEYLKAVINEGMRLYPVLWSTDRVAIEDDQFEEFSFPKNTIIIAFFFGLHRNPALWDDALKFKPERFVNDPKLTKSKNFFPFGAGPRMCIGNNFAMAEMSFFVYAFLSEFEIKPTGQIPEIKPLLTMRPDKIILNISRMGR